MDKTYRPSHYYLPCLHTVEVDDVSCRTTRAHTACKMPQAITTLDTLADIIRDRLESGSDPESDFVVPKDLIKAVALRIYPEGSDTDRERVASALGEWRSTILKVQEEAAKAVCTDLTK